jgi:methionyl aminopeptidase
MKVVNQLPDGIIVNLKDKNWLEAQRVAGRVVAETLLLLEAQVKNKTTLSMIELNQLAEDHIYKSDCTPTFKGYGPVNKPFPAGVCISVNKQLVHGVPTHYKLQEGDVVSFDLGATYEGAIADSALTLIYGEPKTQQHVKLIAACEEALMKGIAAVQVGKRLGCIGNAIWKSCKGNGFQVVTQYGGHGLDWFKPHASPFVDNKSTPDLGVRIQPGLAIAIEPMLLPTDTSTSIASDGWTVMTKEIGSHHEHSIFVHEDHVEIITDRTNVQIPQY